jgi:hypothetical protein
LTGGPRCRRRRRRSELACERGAIVSALDARTDGIAFRTCSAGTRFRQGEVDGDELHDPCHACCWRLGHSDGLTQHTSSSTQRRTYEREHWHDRTQHSTISLQHQKVLPLAGSRIIKLNLYAAVSFQTPTCVLCWPRGPPAVIRVHQHVQGTTSGCSLLGLEEICLRQTTVPV